MVSATTSSPSAQPIDIQPKALAYASMAVVVVVLVLLAAQQALRLPGGQSIEDLLGWVRIEAVAKAVETWCNGEAEHRFAQGTHLRWHIASLYLLVDSLVFMPLYALLILLAGAHLYRALQTGLSPTGQRWRNGLWAWTVLALVALLYLDGVENRGGAVRIGLATVWVEFALACAAVLGGALGYWCVAGHPPLRNRAAWIAAVAALVGGVLLVLAWQAQPPTGCTIGQGTGLSATAHHYKGLAFALAVAPVLLAAAMWFWGFGLQPSARPDRACLRSGLAAIVGRSRYVLVALALFAALTLGLDQCRDVLLGLAKWPGPDQIFTFEGFWGLLVLAVTPMAVGLLVYATWLWTRLACRVLQAGQEPPGSGESLERHIAVHTQLGHFAQGWARFLAMLPLVCMFALTAYALGDAFTAAPPEKPTEGVHSLEQTLWMLLMFGGGCLAMGMGFLWLRASLALKNPADYYNQATDVYDLLADDGKPDQQPQGQWGRAVWGLLRWVTPRRLPIVALLAMLLLRVAMACAPEATASAPVALAVVALALVWWMGVFGALGLVEQAQARPWLLVGVVMVGAMGFLGLSDNHALPWTLPDVAQLADLRLQSAWLLALLVLLSVLAWLLVTWNVQRSRLPTLLRRWGRLGGSVLLWLLAVVALRVFDARMPPPAALADAASRPKVQEALKDWVKALPPDTKRVFLVASEGGGIRSAYWTAQVLQRLHQQFPDFHQASFAFSGVSGGAVGMAAYSACLRQGEAGLDACLKEGFRQQDALSPLLAVGLFEDGLARLLPTSAGGKWLCEHPGCGSMSRAIGFEREWLRAFSTLAQPIQNVPAGQPHLLLNSTWVESGELAVASSLQLDDGSFPAARDVQSRLGAPLNLMASAHVAARFPFINPLALVQPADKKDEKKAGKGHLADGGYFDNSGVTSTAHLWFSMRQAFQDAGRTPPEPLLVLIRNGQKKPDCDKTPAEGPEPKCIVPDPNPIGSPADLAKPALRESWGLYADLLGPAVAVLNVSGIQAHGRLPPAQMRQTLGATERTGVDARVLVIDQLTDASLVPLGWYLSPPARLALDRQAQGVAQALQEVYGVLQEK